MDVLPRDLSYIVSIDDASGHASRRRSRQPRLHEGDAEADANGEDVEGAVRNVHLGARRGTGARIAGTQSHTIDRGLSPRRASRHRLGPRLEWGQECVAVA